MNDRPELTVYEKERSGYLQFVDPDATLVLPAEGESLCVSGTSIDVTTDPYAGLNQFFKSFDSGLMAGWISYDLARYNPLYSLESTAHSPDLGPLLVMAHFPGTRSDYAEERISGGELELGRFTPDQERDNYSQAIRNIRTLIKHGYVYQINYSQRFTTSIRGKLRDLMGSIELTKLPPHSAHGRMGDYEFLSLSPERLFNVDGRTIRTEPIKGTRPRGETLEEDRDQISRLRNSSKDRAEHTMIVDLERNDMNQICEPGTVRVPSLARTESFPTVHHLVSTVEGRLRSDVRFGDLMKRLFPGGSITGCPKRIAIRTIDNLEGRARGLYTGTIGYWDLNEARADWNIAIRTLQRFRDRAWWDAGGGIVIDSTPEKEHTESLDKVELIRKIRRTTTSTKTQRQEETSVQ